MKTDPGLRERGAGFNRTRIALAIAVRFLSLTHQFRDKPAGS